MQDLPSNAACKRVVLLFLFFMLLRFTSSLLA